MEKNSEKTKQRAIVAMLKLREAFARSGLSEEELRKMMEEELEMVRKEKEGKLQKDE